MRYLDRYRGITLRIRIGVKRPLRYGQIITEADYRRDGVRICNFGSI